MSLKKKIALPVFQLVNYFRTRSELFGNIKKEEQLRKQFFAFGSGGSLIFPCYILNAKYISIGSNFNSLWNLRIEAWDSYLDQAFTPQIVIGDNVNFNSDVHIGCIDKVIIGNNVLLASRIFISDHAHGEISKEGIALIPVKRPLVSKGPVIIEDNVWIGEGVCILSGVTIGKNSIIGANSVVTVSVPPNSVAAGIPAKIIKTLE